MIFAYTVCHGQIKLDDIPTCLVSVKVDDKAGAHDTLILNGERQGGGM